MKEKLTKLATDWEGRLFLHNLANQLETGLLDAVHCAPIRNASRGKEDVFVSRRTLFDTGFKSSAADPSDHPGLFAGPDFSLDPDTLLFRILPLDLALNVVKMSRKSVVSDVKQALANFLSKGPAVPPGVRYSDLDPGSAAKSAADARALDYEDALEPLFAGRTGKSYLPDWQLPAPLLDWPMTEANFVTHLKIAQSNANLPVFLSPILKAEALEKTVEKPRCVFETADTFRDLLGLDHFDRTYRKVSAVPLAMVIFRARQLQDATRRRPSPFDHTSPARFRAIHGTQGGAHKMFGCTVDLSKIGLLGSIEGVPELVSANTRLPENDNQVLLGFLGELTIPRGDAYMPYQSESAQDAAFISWCQYGTGTEEVVAYLERTIP